MQQQPHYPTFTITPHGIFMDEMPLTKSLHQSVPKYAQGHLQKAEEYLAKVRPSDWENRTPCISGTERPLFMAKLHAALASPQPGFGPKLLRKAGFNPDEPRDDHGRWTGGGGSTSSDTSSSQQPSFSDMIGALADGINNASDFLQGTQVADSGQIMSDAGSLPNGDSASANVSDLSSSQGQDIVSTASTWEGTPYAPRGTQHQGSAAVMGTAADCSGSVHSIYSEAGLPYTYTKTGDFAEMANTGEIPFRKLGNNEEPQAGDVVLYNGHMSIYDKRRQCVERAQTGIFLWSLS